MKQLNAGITTQLLLSLFKVKGVLHYGIAGNANPELQIGDVTIPQYWAHTGLWNWQVEYCNIKFSAIPFCLLSKRMESKFWNLAAIVLFLLPLLFVSFFLECLLFKLLDPHV